MISTSPWRLTNDDNMTIVFSRFRATSCCRRSTIIRQPRSVSLPASYIQTAHISFVRSFLTCAMSAKASSMLMMSMSRTGSTLPSTWMMSESSKHLTTDWPSIHGHRAAGVTYRVSVDISQGAGGCNAHTWGRGLRVL